MFVFCVLLSCARFIASHSLLNLYSVVVCIDMDGKFSPIIILIKLSRNFTV
jgi:hypothetical protein